MIKNYKDFINENNTYEYGCVMLYFDIENWEDITNIIDPDDIHEEGIENEPHLTLLYGLHKEVTLDEIKNIMKDYNSIEANIEGIDFFDNDEYDVLKFNIKASKELAEINSRLSELPNSNEYKDYKPHLTISYLNKGKAEKYITPNYNMKLIGKRVIYTTPNGDKKEFKL